jgi:hypothetical protein
MQAINKAFFIYTEASVAVFLLILSLLELVCGIMLSGSEAHPVAYLAFSASAVFFAASASFALYVIRSTKAHA